MSIARPTIAQVVPDSTLGSSPSTVQSGVVNGLPALLIQGGAASGSTLFQSFQQFNVGNGQQVYFENPAQIQNILTRVTGNQSSQILGTLGVLGNANLFLLNPNGIYFGSNAKLDIRGSFVASSAERFTFPDGSEFSAVNPQAPPILTVNVPIGVQFGSTPGTIVNQGQLSVGKDLTLSGSSVSSTGELLALQGQVKVESIVGDVQVQKLAAQTATLTANQDLVLQQSLLQTSGDMTLLAGGTVKIQDSETSPFLAIAGQNLTIQGKTSVDIFALNHPDSYIVSGQDLVLRSDNPVIGDARFWAGGDYRIETLDGQGGTLISPNDPIIVAVGDVKFGNPAVASAYNGASLHILAGGSVEILGSITITGTGGAASTIGSSATGTIPGTSVQANNPLLWDDLKLSNGVQIPDINGATKATLDIRAGIDWTKTPFSGTPAWTPPINVASLPTPLPMTVNTSTASPSGASITTGPIRVSVGDGMVFLTNQYLANPTLKGDITVQGATSPVIRTIHAPGTSARPTGGTVVIDSKGSITVPSINANGTGTTGLGGTVILVSQGDITLPVTPSTNPSILNAARINANGQLGGKIQLFSGGAIKIGSSQILSFISSDSLTQTVAGPSKSEIFIQAKNLFATRTNITTRTEQTQQINAGNITMRIDGILQLQDGAIASDVFKKGSLASAGTIDIQAGQILLNNSARIRSENSEEGQLASKSGDIFLKADLIQLSNQSGIQNRTLNKSAGSGGSVQVYTNVLMLDTESFILSGSGTESSGSAGKITIVANDLVTLTGKSFIESSVGSGASGSGGIIDITAGKISLSDSSKIFANVNWVGGTNTTGTGGTVFLRANDFEMTSGSQVITSTSSVGAAGSVYLQVVDQIIIQDPNTGLFANTTAGATGASGSIFIDPIFMLLSNGATINVSNLGTGPGGNILLIANNLTMNNASIVATSFSSTGGNITMTVPGVLFMQNGSQISATAGLNFGAGNGGNILMNTGFIVAAPNQSNLIAANAFLGKGGSIQINTQGIFGFVYDLNDPAFKLPTSNKITASSTFGINGTVTVTTPGVDPSKGLVPLPTDLIDSSRLVARGCPTPGSTVGQFVVLGKGGLPATPGEVLTGDAIVEDTRLPSLPSEQPSALQPAKQWMFNERGEVTLLSEVPAFSCYGR